MTPRILTILIGVGLAQPVLAQHATLITTFTNPTPSANDRFGFSIAAIGNDQVVIGAHLDDTNATNSGAVYLFSTTGALLSTFSNPTAATNGYFGGSVAVVGNDRLLIGAIGHDTGAPGAGAAYLINTSGELLTTFANLTPATNDWFGWSVSAMGTDGVLIGAFQDDTGAINSGAAYLFNTNGTLLTTFSNPTPSRDDAFGFAVTAVGNDMALIGAPSDDAAGMSAGAAYLFRANGTLLTTFTNPSIALRISERLGSALTGVGDDRVLIGAPGSHGGGAAYLFSTNGTLLATFNNPSTAPANFGSSVAAVGSDLVVIGAEGADTTEENAGAAYLFSTTGTLLAILANPTPQANDWFGFKVAAVGSDKVLVSAFSADAGAPDSGAAYLFAVPPTLTILSAATSGTTISWSPDTPGLVLQETGSLSPANWTNSQNGSANPAITPTTEAARFFRLIKP
jgi:hypothetical protein